MSDSSLLLQNHKEFVVDEASSAAASAKGLQISKRKKKTNRILALIFKVVEWRSRGHSDPDI